MAYYAKLARYAIQSWYNLHIDEKSFSVSCDEVIKIPLDLRIFSPTKAYMTPCIAITTKFQQVLEAIKIVIETNEGFTIEPIKVRSELHNGWIYLLTLPPKTTGLKNVKVITGYEGPPHIAQTDLVFDIMYPPYNYEGADLELVSKTVKDNTVFTTKLDKQLNDLTARVTALENKAGG